ncbi:MAG TPA: hypothetical protein ENI85_14860 [Deltaproteobacteria bacterium]|nr:hypothetical protein [Deltaproteobacteria bacterium]
MTRLERGRIDRGNGRQWSTSRRSLAGFLLVLVLAAASSSRAEESSLCGPFEPAAGGSAGSGLRDPGVVPAVFGGVDTKVDVGAIVRLPVPSSDEEDEGGGAGTEDEAESEAILALPKDGSGSIPTDFELGPGARIARSFFSPVICATVARVTGPAGATPTQLVTVVPEGSIVVPNDVYASAAAELEPVEGMRRSGPDPYAPLQYGLSVTGVQEARGLGAGDGVKIALLDSAPEVDHRDLPESRIKRLAEDAPHETGVHGTLMAGVLSAIEGNGFGIIGLAPDAELVSIPVCRPTGVAGGRCTIFDLLQGLDRAWESESAIVNLSLSGPPNPLLERGMGRLEELGVVVVAAAGNEGTGQRRYPAAYPSVVGVGAVDRDGMLFERSNRGTWVELFAPGVEILSTVPNDAFAFGSGTSLAAAHVTGALAILTGLTHDPLIARAELFRTAHARRKSGPMIMPPVCEVLARLGRRCAAEGERSVGPAVRSGHGDPAGHAGPASSSPAR